MKPVKLSLASGAIGAGLSAVLFFAIYDGGVRASDAEATESAATQDSATSDEAPGSAEAVDHNRLRDENERLRQRVAELENDLNEEGEEALEEDQEYEEEEDEWADRARDPAWAPAQEAAIEEKLERYFAVTDASVECRTRCCQITFGDGGEPMDLWHELNSSVGFPVSTGTSETTKETVDGKRLLEAGFCFNKGEAISEEPDRALEREQLLSRAAHALRECALQAAVPFDLKIELTLALDGAIQGLLSTADEIPDDAADCAVTAVIEHADFSPGTRPSKVPIRIRLDPAEVTDD